MKTLFALVLALSLAPAGTAAAAAQPRAVIQAVQKAYAKKEKAGGKKTLDRALGMSKSPGEAGAGADVLWMSGNGTATVYYLAGACLKHPKSALLHNNLGAALNEHGDFAPAAKILAYAESLAPGSPLVLANHGVALVGAGKKKKGEAKLREALAKQPGQPSAHAALAGLEKGRGHDAVAQEHLAKALESTYAESIRDAHEALQKKTGNEKRPSWYRVGDRGKHLQIPEPPLPEDVYVYAGTKYVQTANKWKAREDEHMKKEMARLQAESMQMMAAMGGRRAVGRVITDGDFSRYRLKNKRAADAVAFLQQDFGDFMSDEMKRYTMRKLELDRALAESLRAVSVASDGDYCAARKAVYQQYYGQFRTNYKAHYSRMRTNLLGYHNALAYWAPFLGDVFLQSGMILQARTAVVGGAAELFKEAGALHVNSTCAMPGLELAEWAEPDFDFTCPLPGGKVTLGGEFLELQLTCKEFSIKAKSPSVELLIGEARAEGKLSMNFESQEVVAYVGAAGEVGSEFIVAMGAEAGAYVTFGDEGITDGGIKASDSVTSKIGAMGDDAGGEYEFVDWEMGYSSGFTGSVFGHEFDWSE